MMPGDDSIFVGVVAVASTPPRLEEAGLSFCMEKQDEIGVVLVVVVVVVRVGLDDVWVGVGGENKC